MLDNNQELSIIVTYQINSTPLNRVLTKTGGGVWQYNL